jgi:hypothetical protein
VMFCVTILFATVTLLFALHSNKFKNVTDCAMNNIKFEFKKYST